MGIWPIKGGSALFLSWFVVKLIFETPDVFDDRPQGILFIEKARDYLDITPEFFDFPEGPDSTLLPEPGLFY